MLDVHAVAARVTEALLDTELDLPLEDLDSPATILALTAAVVGAVAQRLSQRVTPPKPVVSGPLASVKRTEEVAEATRELLECLQGTVSKIGPTATEVLLAKAYPLGLVKGRSEAQLEMLALAHERNLDHTVVVSLTGIEKFPIEVRSGSSLLTNLMGSVKPATV